MLNAKDYLGTMFADRYKIIREIGHGASSIVFCAQDVLKGCQVAVKILDKDSNEYMLNSKSFQTEIEALVEMNSHPNIVEIYDASFEGSVHYISMEYVEGCTLRRYMDANGVLPESVIIDITSQVLDALKAAHSVGVVHRDIKPQNILVEETAEGGVPQVKLADFGIARLPEGDRFMMKDRGVGTVHYISPEQASGSEVTPKSDIYSLGVVMYEMATGHVPFDAEKVTAIISKHQTDLPELPQMHNPSISPGLQKVILCAMAKDPARRFRNSDEMQKALCRVKESGDCKVPTNIGVFSAHSQKAEKKAKAPKQEKQPKQKSVSYKPPRSSSGHPRFLKPTLISAAALLLVAAIAVGAVFLIPQLIDRDDVVTPADTPKSFVGETYQSVKDYMSQTNKPIRLGDIHYIYSEKAKDLVIKEQITETEDGYKVYDLWLNYDGTKEMITLPIAHCTSAEAFKQYLFDKFSQLADTMEYYSIQWVVREAEAHDDTYDEGTVLSVEFVYHDESKTGLGYPDQIEIGESARTTITELASITVVVNPAA